MKSTLLVLLLCATQVHGDEKPSAQSPESVSSEQAAIEAIEKLGGRVKRGEDGRVSMVGLSSPDLTDDDLKHLAPLTELRALLLSNTKITDAGLVHLKGLKHLQLLRLTRTKVSDAGVKDLKAALPKCRIDGPAPPPPPPSFQRTPRRAPERFTTSATSTVNRIQVLVLESVREELQLSEDQREKIDEILVAWSKQETETAGGLTKDISREQGRELFAKSRADAERAWDQVIELLTDEQEKRFEQLKLQRSGFRVFVIPPRGLFTHLDVSRQQRQQFAEIYSDWDARYGLPARGTKSWDKLMEKFLAVFTMKQREQWDALIGKPFDFRSTSGRIRGFAFTFPNLGRDARLLQMEWVRDALGISDEQSARIAAALDRWTKARNEIEQRLRSRVPGDDGEKVRQSALRLTDTAVETTDEITNVLTEDQQTRLEQLKLQQQGIRAILEPAIRRELNLSARQLRSISELTRSADPSFRPESATPAPSQEQRRELMAQAIEVLTAEQREKWASMIGTPVEILANPYAPSRPRETDK